jgi:hypothetical protein
MRKVCNKCNIEFSVNDFYRSKNSKDGYLNKCKKCVYDSCYKDISEDKKLIRKMYKIKYSYGLTKEQYIDLKTKCNNACSICGNKERKLCVDHNHTTGKVRGLLCKSCNSGLGIFKDSPEVLKVAIKYLENN